MLRMVFFGVLGFVLADLRQIKQDKGVQEALEGSTGTRARKAAQEALQEQKKPLGFRAPVGVQCQIELLIYSNIYPSTVRALRDTKTLFVITIQSIPL